MPKAAKDREATLSSIAAAFAPATRPLDTAEALIEEGRAVGKIPEELANQAEPLWPDGCGVRGGVQPIT